MRTAYQTSSRPSNDSHGKAFRVTNLPVVGVGADEQGAVLGVKWKVGDVDIAGSLEYSARFPVESTVGM